MTGLFEGFGVGELLRLIPEAGRLTPEAIQARLEDIQSRYTPAEIAAFLMAGTPPPTRVEKPPTRKAKE